MNARKKSITLTLDNEVLEETRTVAESQKRSVSQQVEFWIAEKLDQERAKQPAPQPETAEA